MKGNSTSRIKIRHLRPHEKAYVVDCLAHDVEVKETVDFFKMMFPDFGKGVDPDMLNRILAKRIYDIKRKNRDEIEACRLILPPTPSRIFQWCIRRYVYGILNSSGTKFQKSRWFGLMLMLMAIAIKYIAHLKPNARKH